MVMNRFLCLLALLAVKSVSAEKSDAFHGYKLISVFARSNDKREFLEELQHVYNEVDFWTGPFQNRTSMILLPPHLLDTVEESLTKEGISWKERDVDVARIIRDGVRQTAIPTNRRHVWSAERASDDHNDIVDHHSYHSYNQILSYLEEIKQTYPKNVEVDYLKFNTHEGRKVAMMKLYGKDISSSKPSIIIESGIHAREWISPAATLYSIEKILQKYQEGDSSVQMMLDSFDWFIVPVTNPDGYEFTRKGVVVSIKDATAEELSNH